MDWQIGKLPQISLFYEMKTLEEWQSLKTYFQKSSYLRNYPLVLLLGRSLMTPGFNRKSFACESLHFASLYPGRYQLTREMSSGRFVLSAGLKIV
ncbi:hypothetical protein CDAR_434011 [Caerostris darwini]|uniref:Uncharacterized protein n=1 Tax=Caerostris darwini TaxID=1538125 RepID=A0AAV4S4Y7_9ARAC|nr:hypothetical protein CDAR_434011 [Caerostris darwini]